MSKRSGIYRIVCMVTGMSYVGQSINLDGRILTHMTQLFSNKHPNKHLQSAFNLYGAENFVAEIVEFCDEVLLTSREQFWIDSYGFENLYNICPSADSPRGVVRSEEFKRKLSKTLSEKLPTDKWRQMISERNKGRTFSEDHRRKISEAGMRRVVSDETKEKISNSSKGRVKSAESSEKSAAKRRGQKRTLEQRARMSEGRKKKKEERDGEKS